MFIRVLGVVGTSNLKNSGVYNVNITYIRMTLYYTNTLMHLTHIFNILLFYCLVLCVLETKTKKIS